MYLNVVSSCKILLVPLGKKTHGKYFLLEKVDLNCQGCLLEGNTQNLQTFIQCPSSCGFKNLRWKTGLHRLTECNLSTEPEPPPGNLADTKTPPAKNKQQNLRICIFIEVI